MTAVLDAPAAPEVARPRADRRGGGAVLLAGLLALAGAVWSFLLWAPATAELSAGTTASTGPADVVTVEGYGARGTHVVDYQDGRMVELVVPLRNEGPLPVTLTGVTAGDVRLPLLALAGDDLPVTVAPGESADVVLRGVLGNCAYYHERAVQNVEAMAVQLEVLGRTTTREVALDRPLLVHSPMIVGCPDRTLNRNDDERPPDTDAL